MSSPHEKPELPLPDLTPHLMAAIIESADDAIVSKNLDGVITSWNKGAQRIFGYSAQEAIGQPVLMLIPSDRHSEEDEILRRIRAGERIEHYETIRQRKDKQLIDISLTISPIKNEQGDVVGASKIAREITHIKRTEQRLQASEERYRTLFNSIDEGFCVLELIFDDHNTPLDYRFLEANPAFERHAGLFNVVGKTAREVVPGLEKHWFEIYGRIALTGEPARFTEGSDVMGRWFDVYAFRVGEPEKRQVALLFNDITARRKVESERERLLKQLETERAKLHYLFDKAPAVIATVRGPEHILEMANPAYLQLMGYQDLLGRPLREAVPEVEEQGFVKLLDQVYQTGEPYIGREALINLRRQPQGELEEGYFDFVYQPIYGEAGEVTGIFAHGIEITEQVRARRIVEEANRAKDEFLATLSHELRTPLNAILGWSRMLGDPQLEDEDRAQGLEAIQRNALLQAQLIEDILDVSRIITGKLRLDVRPLELENVIEAAIESLLPAAQAKGIRLQRVLDSGGNVVSGDGNRLQQVVWNLLSNAIKFTPRGGRVQIRVERVNSHLELVVSDTGEGIRADIVPFIFDRFRQADSTSTRAHGGLGLGLAIVRHIVEMHGGTVEAQSAGEGQGATFIVKMPLMATRSVDVEPEKNALQTSPPARATEFDCLPELSGLSVLVVDDEEDARRLIKTVLERCDAHVLLANNAADALRTLREKRPDVLLSDLGMPGEDGYSLIQKVRALPAEEGGKTPAAALTAYARIEDRMKVLRAGFQIHLPKPVEPAELVTVVANLARRP